MKHRPLRRLSEEEARMKQRAAARRGDLTLMLLATLLVLLYWLVCYVDGPPAL